MKQYPTRPKPKNYYDTCECGHGWEYHHIGHGFTRNGSLKECEECMCIKFKLDNQREGTST